MVIGGSRVTIVSRIELADVPGSLHPGGDEEDPRKHYTEFARLLKEALSDPRRLQECALKLEARGYL